MGPWGGTSLHTEACVVDAPKSRPSHAALAELSLPSSLLFHLQLVNRLVGAALRNSGR